MHRLLKIPTAVIAALLLSTDCTYGQASQTSTAMPAWQTAAGGKQEFEVASVRPSAEGTPYSSNVALDGMDGPPPGNLFKASSILMQYLRFAFRINDSVQARAIWDTLPLWSRTQFYTVEARAEGTPARDQVRLMVQSLLADRFKLVVHREMRSSNILTMTLDKPGKTGPMMHPYSPATPCIEETTHAPMIPAPAAGALPPRYCGQSAWIADGQLHVQIINGTMAQIANALASMSMRGGTTITPHAGVDATGLSGTYDMEVHFADTSLAPEEGTGGGPAFASAIKNQLGIKLTEAKGTAEVIVIDHIEQPSAN
jgi:uncharacterized protein (TIGR03435 family)